MVDSQPMEEEFWGVEKARRERSKPKGKRSGHQETSLDSEREEDSKDACEDLNSPYKRPKPTPFTQRITRLKYHRKGKLPRDIRVYEGNKDPKDNLGGAAQNWFDNLDPESVDSFEELSQKFLEEFSQQKRYAKDPTKIHGIKRRQNKGLQAFIDRFKFESSHIKGVPSVLRISAFMHGHGHPKLAKKLNDKIPKMVDEMFERVRAFIRGEVAAGSAKMVRPSQGDKGYILPAWIGGLKKARNRGGPREARRNMGGRNGEKVINMIREGENCKRPFEEGRSGLTDELTLPAIPWNQLTDEPIILEGIIKGNQVRRILVDGGSSAEIMYEHCFRNLNVNIRTGRSKTVLMEFAIIKCSSPYNVIIGRTGMRSFGAIGSTIYSMIKFLANQGIVTMETSRKALWECRQLERMQGIRMGRIRKSNCSMIRHGASTKDIPLRRTSGPSETTHDTRLKTTIKIKGVSMAKGRDDQKVIKSKSELDLVQDVEETLRKLKRVNIKIDPVTSSFGVKEGRFLSYMVTKEGIRADLEKVRMRFETTEGSGWTNEAEESLQRIKRKLNKLQTLAVPKEGEILMLCLRQKDKMISFVLLVEREGIQIPVSYGTFNLSKKLQAKSTPTPRAWRLYLGRETIEEGSGIGIILVSPEEKMYSYAIRLKFNASNHAMDYKALLAGLAASVSKAMKDLHVFMNSPNPIPQVLDRTSSKKFKLQSRGVNRIGNHKVGISQSGSIVGYQNKTIGGRDKQEQEGKAASNVPGVKPNYNWEVSGSN
ncbi:reverse transcriptase domain-containing protein [Tanacetum coccineum]